MIDVSIVVVTYNSEADIAECLQSIGATAGSLSVEIFVVDNHSLDRTIDVVRGLGGSVRLIANAQNAGFPVANNQAIPLAAGRYIMLLNPDTVVLPGAIETIVRHLDEHPDCGVCGPRLIDASGAGAPELFAPGILQAITRYGRLTRHQHRFLDKKNLVLSGACLVFRRELVSEVGLLDPRLFWAEDSDFCMRARRAGYGVQRVLNATVMHKAGQSAKSDIERTLYAQNANYIRMIRLNYESYERAVLISVRLIEIVLRALKYSVVAAFTSRGDAQQRAAGLRRAMRDAPAILFGGRNEPRETGCGVARLRPAVAKRNAEGWG